MHSTHDSDDGMDIAQRQAGLADTDNDTGAELADLMTESREQAAVAPELETDSLDDLLAESLGAVNSDKLTRAARDRRKRGNQTATERIEDEARIRAWELRNEWKAVANVAMFERHSCNCGRHQTIFRQLMTRQVHRHMRGSQRWQQAEASKADLPNEVVVQKWNTPMCVYCSPQVGFEFTNVKEWQE